MKPNSFNKKRGKRLKKLSSQPPVLTQVLLLEGSTVVGEITSFNLTQSRESTPVNQTDFSVRRAFITGTAYIPCVPLAPLQMLDREFSIHASVVSKDKSITDLRIEGVRFPGPLRTVLTLGGYKYENIDFTAMTMTNWTRLANASRQVAS